MCDFFACCGWQLFISMKEMAYSRALIELWNYFPLAHNFQCQSGSKVSLKPGPFSIKIIITISKVINKSVRAKVNPTEPFKTFELRSTFLNSMKFVDRLMLRLSVKGKIVRNRHVLITCVGFCFYFSI